MSGPQLACLVGIALVGLTGYLPLDPLVAILVAINIMFTGYRLLVRSGRGLMDQALPPEETAAVQAILDSYQARGVQCFTRWRSRQAAARRFLVAHLLVPGNWTIRHGHKLAEEIEAEVAQPLPNSNMVTHLEPADDPTSMRDVQIDRGD